MPLGTSQQKQPLQAPQLAAAAGSDPMQYPELRSALSQPFVTDTLAAIFNQPSRIRPTTLPMNTHAQVSNQHPSLIDMNAELLPSTPRRGIDQTLTHELAHSADLSGNNSVGDISKRLFDVFLREFPQGSLRSMDVPEAFSSGRYHARRANPYEHMAYTMELALDAIRQESQMPKAQWQANMAELRQRLPGVQEAYEWMKQKLQAELPPSPTDLLVRPDVTPKSQMPSQMAPSAQPIGAVGNFLQNLMQGVTEGSALPFEAFGLNFGEPERPMPFTQTASMLGGMLSDPVPDVLGAAALGAKPAVQGVKRLRQVFKGRKGTYTIERLGGANVDSADEALERLATNERVPAPPHITQAVEPELQELDIDDFDFGGIESSDAMSRYDNVSAPISSDPLIDAVFRGTTRPYDQLWAIRDEAGNPKWGVVSSTNVVDIDGHEITQLTTDIGVIKDGGLEFQTKEGFNDLGMSGMGEVAKNVLAWYQSKGINPQTVGGWRVRVGRDRAMSVPAERVKAELAAAWAAAFGVAAVVPQIIFEQSDSASTQRSPTDG